MEQQASTDQFLQLTPQEGTTNRMRMVVSSLTIASDALLSVSTSRLLPYHVDMVRWQRTLSHKQDTPLLSSTNAKDSLVSSL